MTSDEAEAAVEEAFGNRPFTPVVIETPVVELLRVELGVDVFTRALFVFEENVHRTGVGAEHDGDGTGAGGVGQGEGRVGGGVGARRRCGHDQPTPEEEALEAKEREANGASTTTSEESSFSWSKLNNMKVGEIPLVVAGAALSTTASVVTTIARKTPDRRFHKI